MLASALQQMGDKEQQYKALREGLHKIERHLGVPAVGWIETDDNLASLRDDPRYQAIIDGLRAAAHD